MILTPKNWNSFQHYKDRAPAWIKLHKALLDDYEFSCLPVASKALAPLLWLLASEYEDGKIRGSVDKIAFRLRMTRGELADALCPLIEKCFFDASEALAECLQVAIPEREIEDIEKKEEKEEERESRARDFDIFWTEYPNKVGKPAALKSFRSALKRAEFPTILAGLAAYIRCKPPDRQWLNPATFLNQNRWEDQPAPNAAPRQATVHQQRQAEGKDVLNALREFNSGQGGGSDPGVLRYDSGDVTESVCGGPGGNLIELPAGRHRSSG